MSVKVTDKDMGLAKLIARKHLPGVRVGVLGSSGEHSDGINMVELAAIHEFGVPGKIPSRSFIRSTVDKNNAKIETLLGKAIKRSLLEGADITRELKRIGAWVEGEIKTEISNGIPPALAESTIARKGSSKPLIDTGQLRNAIAYEVVP